MRRAAQPRPSAARSPAKISEGPPSRNRGYPTISMSHAGTDTRRMASLPALGSRRAVDVSPDRSREQIDLVRPRSPGGVDPLGGAQVIAQRGRHLDRVDAERQD